jgi:hypothetical protein
VSKLEYGQKDHLWVNIVDHLLYLYVNYYL